MINIESLDRAIAEKENEIKNIHSLHISSYEKTILISYCTIAIEEIRQQIKTMRDSFIKPVEKAKIVEPATTDYKSRDVKSHLHYEHKLICSVSFPINKLGDTCCKIIVNNGLTIRKFNSPDKIDLSSLKSNVDAELYSLVFPTIASMIKSRIISNVSKFTISRNRLKTILIYTDHRGREEFTEYPIFTSLTISDIKRVCLYKSSSLANLVNLLANII